MSKLKALNGRAATKEDVDAGTVVFYIPDGRSEAYWLGAELPLLTKIAVDTLKAPFLQGTEVEIFQAEIVDKKDVLVGFVLGEAEGVGMLSDVSGRYCSKEQS